MTTINIRKYESSYYIDVKGSVGEELQEGSARMLIDDLMYSLPCPAGWNVERDLGKLGYSCQSAAGITDTIAHNTIDMWLGTYTNSDMIIHSEI